MPPTIARVEPLTTTRAVRGPFDYRLPPEHEVQVGTLLQVPFGGRRLPGVVLELRTDSELAPDRLAEPHAVIDLQLPADLVELAGWISREYCSTRSRALGLMLPPRALQGLRAKRVLVAELTSAGRAALVDPPVRLTPAQRELLGALSGGMKPSAELGTSALRRLESRGLVEITERVQRRRPARHDVGSAPAGAPPLTAGQAAALEPILAALSGAAGSGERFLLHGVTGSGKTEVYLQAVEQTLAANRSAIVLVPEIALTPQALARFTARFGEVIAVLHSGLSDGERHDEWRRLAGGEARVCVGPRSAVFAPLADIGLIVVDEEHESSYKNEGDPRYDARAVAAHRAEMHGAVLLAGSATPRPEAVHELARLRLPHRVDGGGLPPVEILDMRGAHHPLHPETRMALADLRHAGGKGILLLNRRGWSNFLSCRACGRVWMCPNCEVALVLHQAEGFLACHHCGHRERVPERCPACASVAIARHGAGTERVERELAAALGTDRFPVLRLDAGHSGLTRRAETLEAFAAAPAGLLVGTQMVAKGHDFPNVSLGIVLDADATLRFPDFRAEERTFALVTQLAGRAGRGAGGSRVLVQTRTPEARSLEFASRHDADGFLADELARRQLLRYPPFSTLIRIVCAAEGAPAAATIAEALAADLGTAPGDVLGPAPLFRLRGRHRFQLLIKALQRSATVDAVGAAVERQVRAAGRAGVSVSVDVDPQ
jgi:primosomal protein N' (replication factor Y)